MVRGNALTRMLWFTYVVTELDLRNCSRSDTGQTDTKACNALLRERSVEDPLLTCTALANTQVNRIVTYQTPLPIHGCSGCLMSAAVDGECAGWQAMIVETSHSQYSMSLHILAKHKGSRVSLKRSPGRGKHTHRAETTVLHPLESIANGLMKTHLAGLATFACRSTKSMTIGEAQTGGSQGLYRQYCDSQDE